MEVVQKIEEVILSDGITTKIRKSEIFLLNNSLYFIYYFDLEIEIKEGYNFSIEWNISRIRYGRGKKRRIKDF